MWVVRSWRRRARGSYPPVSEDCLQVGQVSGVGLVRLVAGRQRTMRFRDRSVCGSTAFRANEPIDPATAPLLVERLVGGSGIRPTGFAHTIVAGVLPNTVSGIALVAAGRHVPLVMSNASRAFLAIMPGSVRRRDLTLTFERPGTRQVVDFGTGVTGASGDRPIVRGSLATPIVVHDARATSTLALVTYRVREATVHGPVTEPCAEPTELIHAEPGVYNARWADFLDAPTLVALPEFNDNWRPSGLTASSIASCLNGVDDFSDGPVGGLGVQRIDPRLVVVHGFLAPGVTGLQVTTPAGRQADAIIEPTGRAFLAPVPSRGRVGDQLRLTAIGGHPKTTAQTVALGDQRLPQPFHYQLRNRRRTIYVAWDGGGQPFAGADVTRDGDRFAVSVLDLFPPDFAPDGSPYGIGGFGTYSCANINLRSPVPRLAKIIDASTGRRIRPSKLLPGPRRFRCPSVRPGQHVDIPWSKTLR